MIMDIFFLFFVFQLVYKMVTFFLEGEKRHFQMNMQRTLNNLDYLLAQANIYF